MLTYGLAPYRGDTHLMGAVCDGRRRCNWRLNPDTE